MDDSGCVSCIESIGDFNGQRQQNLGIQRTSGDAMFQGHALQELHGNELAILVTADFVNGADVGMVQSRSGTGLSAKAVEGLRILSYVVRQKFQSDEAPKIEVF